MYSSLQRMDITTQGERGIIAVQTDHRSPEEMEEQREISTIFAVTRVLNPLRAEGTECEAVKHVGAHPPADFMTHVLRCAGAHIEIEGRDAVAPEPDDEEVNRLFNIAMEDLAKKVAEEHGVRLDEGGLVELQDVFHDLAGEGVEEDEISYWESAVSLAAVTGEIIRREHGGQWVRDPDWYSTLPFVYSVTEAADNLINVFGKIERFFDRGSIDAPVHLLRMAADTGAESGPFLPNLRPADWRLAESVLCERLIADNEETPWIAYGNDRPETFGYEKLDEGADIEAKLAEARRPAIDNLRSLPVERDVVSQDPLILVISGNYFAAEKLLDPRYVQGLHDELGEMLIAGMPEKGAAFVASMDATAGFVSFISSVYTQAEPINRLSPEVYLLHEGKFTGMVKVSYDSSGEGGSTQPKQGLLRRIWSSLFG